MTRIISNSIPIIIAFIALTAGCVELFYPELGNQSQNTEKGNTGQVNTGEVKLDIEYSPAALSKYPTIWYDSSEDAFITYVQVKLSSELGPGTKYKIRLKELNSGWESSGSYIFKFVVPELGYTPEFEVCEQHANRYGLNGDYSQERCIRKSLPPIELNLDISPSTVDIELEPYKDKEAQVVVSNKGIFSVSQPRFKTPEDQQNRVYISPSTFISSLNPGENASITIKARSTTKEQFEFKGEIFAVALPDNLEQYLYNKSFTINIKQK